MPGLKILIAEDDLVSLRLMEASLINWGHQAVTAKDGEQALGLLQQGGIQVCILDWEMPKKSGIEVCRWIRAAHLQPDPYIIMLTSHKELEHISAGYDAGVDSYISKPFDRNFLRHAISRITDNDSASGGTPSGVDSSTSQSPFSNHAH